MDEIDGAAWRLMVQRWALSPYEVLAGKLTFCNKQRRDDPPRNVVHARLLLRLVWRYSRRNRCKPLYSAAAGNGSDGDALAQSCRGRPIRAGWNSTAAANVQNNAKAISLPILNMLGYLDAAMLPNAMALVMALKITARVNVD